MSKVNHGNLLSNQPHIKDHGSVEVEMISLTSHDHPLFRNDDGDVYDSMERSLSGSQYDPAIVRFCNNQEGNEAFWVLVAHKSGNLIWEKRIKYYEYYTMNHK